MYSVGLVWEYLDPNDPRLLPDGPFLPNTLNTVTFLLQFTMGITTFVANYTGAPFMQKLTDNKAMYRTAATGYGLAVVVVLEVFLPINDFVQLSAVPEEIRLSVLGVLVGDVVMSCAAERGCRWLFSDW